MVVVGDVNSTLAAALVAKYYGFPLAHVEAGLRSGDKSMPEEVNRVVVDRLADIRFCTEPSGVVNLLQEGCLADNVHLVGSVLIDSLVRQARSNSPSIALSSFLSEISPQYAYLTLHRPSNVDCRANMEAILEALQSASSKDRQILFPMHPRTRKNLVRLDLRLPTHVFPLPPVTYSDSVWLMQNAQIILTDSGGVQEEATWLGTPCVTIRTSTERQLTIEKGTNVLGGTEKETILAAIDEALNKEEQIEPPFGWDGKAAERITAILLKKEFC
jgi:UDP-N-acetylglucosamine 2-epimerase (non-hydrolysing)